MNLSIREIAKDLGLSPRTVYRYVEEHRSYLEVSREGKRLLVSQQCLPILKTVTEFYRQGMTASQVQAELARQNVPVIIEASEEGQTSLASTTGDVLGLVLNEVRELCRQRDAEREERSLLLDLLRQQADELVGLREEMAELRKAMEPAGEPLPEHLPIVVATPRRRGFWGWLRGSKQGEPGTSAIG